MDKQFLRKYFMSKLDSAQREVEILKGAVASLDADNETAEETSEEEVAAPSKKAAAKTDAKSSKKAAAKKEEAEEETEAEADAESVEESDDDMFGEDEAEEDDQPTVDDVRKIVKSFATKFGKDAALKLLKKFKATAIPELKKNEYAKVIELANRHLKK